MDKVNKNDQSYDSEDLSDDSGDLVDGDACDPNDDFEDIDNNLCDLGLDDDAAPDVSES